MDPERLRRRHVAAVIRAAHEYEARRGRISLDRLLWLSDRLIPASYERRRLPEVIAVMRPIINGTWPERVEEALARARSLAGHQRETVNAFTVWLRRIEQQDEASRDDCLELWRTVVFPFYEWLGYEAAVGWLKATEGITEAQARERVAKRVDNPELVACVRTGFVSPS